MKKLIYGLAAGLTLLASTALAKDIDYHIIRNRDIVQVANKEALKHNYAGDIFFHYRKAEDKWILDRLTYMGKGMYLREHVRDVNKEEVPTYIEGFYSLYYDPDQDEECLVAIFDETIDSKVKEEWIKIAKKHIKELNDS